MEPAAKYRLFHALMVLFPCLVLAACGVQRPLIAPKDIPAYQEQRQKKRDRIEQEKQEEIEKANQEGAAK